jgi:hypothetical protein
VATDAQGVDYADVLHVGAHTFYQAPIVPASSFGDDDIDASDPLGCTKVDHQYIAQMAQAHGTAATAERRVVHIARAAGTFVSVQVCPVVAATGDSTATVDVKKNGTTILSGTVTIDNGDVAYSKTSAALSVTSYVAGDVIEVVQTVSAGTGTLPQGMTTTVVMREAA